MTGARKNIFYAGLDTEILPLFMDVEFFEIVGCAVIEYLYRPTLNPFNVLVKKIYNHRYQRTKNSRIEIFYRAILFLVSPFTSSCYKKYLPHVLYLSQHQIPTFKIIDRELDTLNLDALIINVWDMLPDNILSIPKYGTINIHPSKLPQYRGAVPTLMSLRNKDKETAVSYMVLKKGMDKGRVIYQHPISIEKNETAMTLEVKISKAVSESFIPKILDYLNGTLVPSEQNEEFATYTPKHERYREIIPATETAGDICNKIFLYPHFEPDTFCYVYFKNIKVYIKNIHKLSDEFQTEQIKMTLFNLKIKTKDSLLFARLFIDIDITTSFKLLFI